MIVSLTLLVGPGMEKITGFSAPGPARPATILHLMGCDHTKLTFRHSGRDYRLTGVHGEGVRKLLG